MTMRQRVIGSMAVVLIGAAITFLFAAPLTSWLFGPRPSSVERGSNQADVVADIEVLVRNLVTPWEVVHLPNGDLLVSERSGNLKRVGENGQAYVVEDVQETSEGGLMGVALHPDFAQNNYLYLCYTTTDVGGLTNKVVRVTLDGNALSEPTDIVTDIPAAQNHDGGRIAFGPDDKLYITTGDAQEEALAQDTSSLAGKILRVNDDGTLPADNPFSNAVWSYGHRNPQGLAWDDEGRLWSSEHGPSGLQSGNDEINLIKRGANYGWPVIVGEETADGMESPILTSGNSDTWAPASLAYVDGSLYFAGLRGQSLYEAIIQDDGSLQLVAHFIQEYGRLRAVSVSEQQLYVSTSNRDGRGAPEADDDRIIRIDPTAL